METPNVLFAAKIDDSNDPADVIDMMLLTAFVQGEQRYAVTARLQRVRSDAALVPAEVELQRKACEPGRWAQLATGPGWTLRAVRWRDATATVVVTATSEDLARTVLAEATEAVTEPLPPVDDATSIGFWHLGPHGPMRAVRSIATIPWAKIRPNYASSVVGPLDRLMALRPPALAGRLLLLHGPPGTGKTTALRALASAWRSWCRVDYVLDPERLLGEPSYLMEAVLSDDDYDANQQEDMSISIGCGEDESPTGPKRWRMLVLEDCDELIAANAKQSSGQALSRLLNLTDGIVGQGLDAMVCITTNEELTRLHPAIVRPGRCLARIHIGPLPPDEASAWLGNGKHVNPGGTTLAELFALRGDLDQVEKEEDLIPGGQYL